MESKVRKRFARALTSTGIGAALILLGPNLMQPNMLGCEAYSDYVKQQKSAYKKATKESFMGSVYEGDYDHNPDLDFAIKTQERPGQNYLIEDVQTQPYESIRIHRAFDKKLAKVLDEIRKKINKLHEEGQNKVIVFGRYTTDSEMTKGEYNGFLELTAIWIYDKEGNRKIYAIEGVIGGVR